MPDPTAGHLLLALILIPGLATIALLLTPPEQRRTIHVIAVITSLLCLALSFIIFFGYDFRAGGYQFQERYAWIPSFGVTLHLGVDGISAPMVLLTGIVMLTACLISTKIKLRVKEHYVLLLVLVLGVFGVFTSLDLFFLFFFYELAVLPMYPLIGIWGSSSDFGTFRRTKEYSAMKLVLYLVAGSVPIWIGLIAMYFESGIHSFNLMELEGVAFSETFQRVFFPFFMIGFGVLAGLWPFHTWSPDGHVAAPTAVSMLHAGVLMKLGAYGVLRVGMDLLPAGAAAWAPLLIALGTVNVVYGAISAMAQTDLKYVIGYSSVSHMGYVMMGLATLSVVGVNGAVLQMFSHGIMTALFFSLVGVIYDSAHTREIAIFGGLAKRVGKVAICFSVAGLASLGLPGLSGFVAEVLVFVGIFQTYPILGVLAVVGAAITAVYILRLLAKVFFGPLETRWEGLPDASRVEMTAMGILMFFLIAVGVFPSPFIDRITTSVGALLMRIPGAV